MSVGDTPSACATAGPIAGPTSTPIETSAWMASVMASTRPAPESAGAAVGGAPRRVRASAGGEGGGADRFHPGFPAALKGPPRVRPPAMSTPGPRVALIHATPLAVEPIQAAFVRHWPAAVRMNLLDDSLS